MRLAFPFIFSIVFIAASAKAKVEVAESTEQVKIQITEIDAKNLRQTFEPETLFLADDELILTCSSEKEADSCLLIYDKTVSPKNVLEITHDKTKSLYLTGSFATKAIGALKYMEYTGDRTGTIYLNFQSADQSFTIHCITALNGINDQCSFQYLP